MNIALIGYGKMGKAIEEIANQRGHQIVARLTSQSELSEIPENTDVAIEFTRPESAKKNISYCIENQIPIVIGTTGWYDEFEAICSKNNANNNALLYATNFSVGVNIFFQINKKLAEIMDQHKEYALGITEIHHTQKLDAPSGTAITTAQGILESSSRFNKWELVNQAKRSNEESIPVFAERLPDVPGTHIVDYTSDIDTIELKHTAHNRKGFALGSVLAAEFIKDKQGVFTMNDVLNL
ncbi:MAG: 4-hydroxy-tetrahydrodipicolinate reductase [Crocinitomicaceae bacterium]|nr:4-hydroxy-tetrahydrodipicolinate reductase [Crocinitomicaceae bacterium]